MRLSIGLMSLCLVLIPAATPAHDLNTVILADEGLEAQRRLAMETELALQEDQKKIFLPLYDEYYEKRMAIYKRMLDHVNHYAREYASLSDEQAVSLVDEHLVAEARLVALHQEYRSKLQAVLSPKQVMRFYQIDYKITAQASADIAAIIPLVKLGAGRTGDPVSEGYRYSVR